MDFWSATPQEILAAITQPEAIAPMSRADMQDLIERFGGLSSGKAS